MPGGDIASNETKAVLSVIADAAPQNIIAGPAEQDVIANAAIDFIIGGIAENHIVAITCIDISKLGNINLAALAEPVMSILLFTAL
mgnify:CR=1 FL=1